MDWNRILDWLWPWRVMRRQRRTHAAELTTLNQFINVQQSYRQLVAGFQTFCQRAMPEDSWRGLVSRYIKDRYTQYVGLIPEARKWLEMDGFTMVRDPEDFVRSGPIKVDQAAMESAWSALREKWQSVSEPLCRIAQAMDAVLPDGPEKSAGLRKLLEAKDCFVRAKLDK